VWPLGSVLVLVKVESYDSPYKSYAKMLHDCQRWQEWEHSYVCVHHFHETFHTSLSIQHVLVSTQASVGSNYSNSIRTVRKGSLLKRQSRWIGHLSWFSQSRKKLNVLYCKLVVACYTVSMEVVEKVHARLKHTLLIPKWRDTYKKNMCVTCGSLGTCCRSSRFI
jgi:hypothetical protein